MGHFYLVKVSTSESSKDGVTLVEICPVPLMRHREAQNDPKTFNRDEKYQHEACWFTLEPFHTHESPKTSIFFPKKQHEQREGVLLTKKGDPNPEKGTSIK